MTLVDIAIEIDVDRPAGLPDRRPDARHPLTSITTTAYVLPRGDGAHV
jgi:hypothetical protein